MLHTWNLENFVLSTIPQKKKRRKYWKRRFIYNVIFVEIPNLWKNYLRVFNETAGYKINKVICFLYKAHKKIFKNSHDSIKIRTVFGKACNSFIEENIKLSNDIKEELTEREL